MANNSSWRKAAILTLNEGAIMEEIIAANDCANVSQLLKKIAHNEAITISIQGTASINNETIKKALSITKSATILELCRKIADGQLAIIIK